MANQIFGRYVLKELLGKTGMSTVYAAHDPNFDRDVAVKLLPAAMLNDETSRLRFEREAQTIAMLENPAIVPVYDFGEVDGQPYMVMRLMTGGSLIDRISKGKMELAEAARIIKHVASGLDEAHAKGVVHRDLKPGNILFDDNNLPYLADFGIAKLAETNTTLTGNVIIGTPAYMSPEQGRGGGAEVDHRSDIYSLGVILFEMLTNQLPYTADTSMGQVIKHITAPIPNILELRQDLPAEIQTVINRVLSKRKISRYNSASEFAQALEGLLAGGTKVDLKNMPTVAEMSIPDGLIAQAASQKGRATPVSARRRVAVEQTPTIAEKPVKIKNRRSKLPVIAGLVVVLALVAGGAFLLPGILNKPLSLTPTQQLAVLPGQPTETPTAKVNLPSSTPAPALENTSTQATEPAVISTSEPVPTQLASLYLPVNDISFSDIASYMDVAKEISAGNFSNFVKLYVSGASAYYDLDWAPDGSTVAVGTTVGIYLYQPGDLTQRPKWLSAQAPVLKVQFSQDGKLLLAAEDQRLVLWDWRSEAQVKVIPGNGKRINYATFSQNGDFVVGGMRDTFVWRVSDGEQVFHLPGVPASRTSISADGSLLAAAIEGQAVRVFRVGDSYQLAEFRLFDATSVYMLPSGKNVIGITPDTLHMWSLQSNKELGSLGGSHPVIALNGKNLALDNQQGMLQIWAINENGFGSYRMREFAYDKRYEVSFTLSSNGSLLAYWYTRDIQYKTEFTPGNIVVYDVIENVQKRDVKIHGEFVQVPHFQARFSQDGSHLASVSNHRNLEIIDISPGSTDHQITSQSLTGNVGSLPFNRLRVDFGSRNKEVVSQDGFLRAKVSPSDSSLVSVVEMKDNSLVSDIPANLVEDTDLAFSPDGEILATISTGGTIRLWNARSAKQVCVIGGLGAVASITDADRLFFTSDGRSLVIYHADSDLTFWNTAKCFLEQSFDLSINSYSKDHSMFVQLAPDGLVFRKFEDGTEIGKIYGEYLDVAFSEDGLLLAAFMWDGTLHIWGAVQP